MAFKRITHIRSQSNLWKDINAFHVEQKISTQISSSSLLSHMHGGSIDILSISDCRCFAIIRIPQIISINFLIKHLWRQNTFYSALSVRELY